MRSDTLVRTLLACAWCACGVAVLLVALGGICPPIEDPGMITKATVNKTAALLDHWKTVFGAYPPGDVSRIAEVAGVGPSVEGNSNGLCEGAEAVVQAFAWPGFGLDPEWNAGELRNADEDRLAAPITPGGDAELYEVVDAWGNPLVYFRADEYERFAAEGARLLDVPGDEVLARPLRDGRGGFLHPDTFQLFSMGPDGEPNTDDDVVPRRGG